MIHPGTRILMYHYVRPADAPVRVGAGSVDLETFGAQLDHLVRTGTPISWQDVISDRPSPSDGFLLTFDDGHDDHHRYVLPMLLERGKVVPLMGTHILLLAAALVAASGLTPSTPTSIGGVSDGRGSVTVKITAPG